MFISSIAAGTMCAVCVRVELLRGCFSSILHILLSVVCVFVCVCLFWGLRFVAACVSLPIGTNWPLVAIGKVPNTIGKLMIGKTLAVDAEETTNAMIRNDVLVIYW